MIDPASRKVVGHKVKAADEIARLIGSRPRDRKVIMCHGTFDIVHPGHVRHLLYAKSKADILIASLTADVHITKGNYRPYVPQELRALNLAALECVDYVLVDSEATPLKNIALIKPDYFAKGYEYHNTGAKTALEQSTVAEYGGEILFTPGDVVYSSSHIIETDPPSLATDKLIALLDAEGIGFGDLHKVLQNSGGLKVHVVGDTIIDTYTHCAPIGGVGKTPTMSVRFENQEDFVGGAGIVAMHLRAAGANVTFSTVLGADKPAEFALDALNAAGVTTLPVIDRMRPTTQKNTIVAGGYRLLKIDTVDNRSIADKTVNALAEQLGDIKADVVVFSDFRHGMFNRDTIKTLRKAIPSGVMRVADSQVASRWGNILEFEFFDLITPNEREARFALGDQDSAVIPLARDLYKRAKCQTLILKLGERGSITYRHRSEPRAFFNLDSFANRVIDAVGAGDALLAYAVMGMASGPVAASVLGSFAAALECERDGNIPITAANVAVKLNEVQRLTTQD